MSSRIRIDENQLPKYYRMLEPICEKLGIEVPELYLELNVNPNAYTYGDTKPFIVMTSGLIDTVPEELIPTVLAHECGHIACHHTLYRTMGQMILSGTMGIPGIGALISLPLQIAFAYWMRCSEFSADRAAILVDGDAENIIDLCMRLSGYTKNVGDEAHKAEFLKQAEEYKALIKDDVLNQTMEFMILAGQSHPLTAVRAYEANAWASSDNVTKLLSYYGEVSRSMPHTEVPIGEAAALMKGRNAEALAAELKDAGFTDVTCVRETTADLFTSEGSVTGITINGASDFNAESWFPSDAKIEISYYAPLTPEEEAAAHPGEIRMPMSSLSCYGRDYVSLCQEFVNAGFKNIFTVQDPGIRPLFLKDGGVTKVTIGEVSDFEKGDWFPAAAKIRVLHF